LVEADRDVLILKKLDIKEIADRLRVELKERRELNSQESRVK
jgi:hypothetical protein